MVVSYDLNPLIDKVIELEITWIIMCTKIIQLFIKLGSLITLSKT